MGPHREGARAARAAAARRPVFCAGPISTATTAPSTTWRSVWQRQPARTHGETLRIRHQHDSVPRKGRRKRCPGRRNPERGTTEATGAAARGCDAAAVSRAAEMATAAAATVVSGISQSFSLPRIFQHLASGSICPRCVEIGPVSGGRALKNPRDSETAPMQPGDLEEG